MRDELSDMKKYFSKLKFNYLQLFTKQRFLENLVLSSEEWNLDSPIGKILFDSSFDQMIAYYSIVYRYASLIFPNNWFVSHTFLWFLFELLRADTASFKDSLRETKEKNKAIAKEITNQVKSLLQGK